MSPPALTVPSVPLPFSVLHLWPKSCLPPTPICSPGLLAGLLQCYPHHAQGPSPPLCYLAHPLRLRPWGRAMEPTDVTSSHPPGNRARASRLVTGEKSEAPRGEGPQRAMHSLRQSWDHHTPAPRNSIWNTFNGSVLPPSKLACQGTAAHYLCRLKFYTGWE